MCLFEVAPRSELRAGVGELRLTLVLVFFWGGYFILFYSSSELRAGVGELRLTFVLAPYWRRNGALMPVV